LIDNGKIEVGGLWLTSRHENIKIGNWMIENWKIVDSGHYYCYTSCRRKK
jgi:hypothetical protein